LDRNEAEPEESSELEESEEESEVGEFEVLNEAS